MSVSEALVSSFLPFTHIHISHSRIRQTSRFTFLSFGSTHAFKIPCNSYGIFSSTQNIWPRIVGSMTTIRTYIVVFTSSCKVSILKNVVLVRIDVEYGYQVCPISLYLWNVYPCSLGLVVLQCDPQHVIIRFPFSNRTQNFPIIISFFRGKLPSNAL